jgi:hypothetical protein
MYRPPQLSLESQVFTDIRLPLQPSRLTLPKITINAAPHRDRHLPTHPLNLSVCVQNAHQNSTNINTVLTSQNTQNNLPGHDILAHTQYRGGEGKRHKDERDAGEPDGEAGFQDGLPGFEEGEAVQHGGEAWCQWWIIPASMLWDSVGKGGGAVEVEEVNDEGDDGGCVISFVVDVGGGQDEKSCLYMACWSVSPIIPPLPPD